MIWSEGVAKTKWCPMARPEAAANSGSEANRASDGTASDRAMCLGTGCMIWVETDYLHGYCGLIKRPT